LEGFIILALIILIVLAIADLVVGVGNDAVNFLNSAIGSKVASFRTIMIVATLGIMVGAISSAGMMEIAREGIFNPEYFTLEDVMIIFLAVMLTDILLLDAFNTIGFPTSTTVSIIFELLGASVIVAAYKIMSNNLPLNYLFNINDPSSDLIGFLNWSKTNTIVTSIFLSVLIAFSLGIFVMFISRMLFSFDYKRKLKFVGIIWASLAMLAMSYFLVYKGLKSTYSVKKMYISELIDYKKAVDPKSSETLEAQEVIYITDVKGNRLEFNLVKDSKTKEKEAVYEVFFGNKSIKQFADSIKDNMPMFLFSFFIFWIIVFLILFRWGINPLKIVVFAGTFSLAMAFAGNDLVNFIGVPLAGWQSYDLFNSANLSSEGLLLASEYTMIGLKFPIQTPYFFLIIAGIIMVLTLWFSKKARTVTETEVKLSTQDEVDENFSSNVVSRLIVRGSIGMSQMISSILPSSIKTKINNQFLPFISDNETEAPAFDLVRASVNLTMASMLIAFGTSLKLPLSTTYVSFMVAMGTSLADRAWGRESATYRIAGVINVIGGWFVTAFVAFIVAGLVALVLINFKLFGLILMFLGLIGFIIYTSYKHRLKVIKTEKSDLALQSIDLSTDLAMQKTAVKIAESLNRIASSYNLALAGLLSEDLTTISQAKTVNEDLVSFYSDVKNNLFKAIKKSKLSEKQTAQLYILSNDLMQDILQSLSSIINAADNHVKNAHKPLNSAQKSTIIQIVKEVMEYLKYISKSLQAHDYLELTEVRANKRSIFDHIESALSHQVEGVAKKEYGFKNTDIFLNILLETKDLVAISVRFSKLLHRLNKGQSPLGNR